MSITGTSATGYTMTANALNFQDAFVPTFMLEVTLTNYPNPILKQDLSVTVSSAICDCELLLWDEPTPISEQIDVATGPMTITIPKATPNENSKTLTPQIRKCYANGNQCPESATFAPLHLATNGLPEFITQDG